MIRNSLKKIEIAKNLRLKKGYSLSYSKTIIDNLIYSMSQILKTDNFILKNIGSFKLKNKAERIGRNPKSGEIYKIKKRKVLSFKTSKKLNNLIN